MADSIGAATRQHALTGHVRPTRRALDGSVCCVFELQIPNVIANVAGSVQALSIGQSVTLGMANSAHEWRVLGVGPRRYMLVLRPPGAIEGYDCLGAPSQAALPEGLRDLESWADLTHARVVVRVSGEATLDLLAKGCPVDLKALALDQCASSLLGDVPVLYDRREDGFEIYIPRTYAQSAWEWLVEGAAEFGYEVQVADGVHPSVTGA